MPKPHKQKRPTDVNQLAHYLVEESTTERTGEVQPPPNLSVYMAAIGRKGGQIGGKRRLQTMTAKKRKQVAKRAARARWAKKRS